MLRLKFLGIYAAENQTFIEKEEMTFQGSSIPLCLKLPKFYT